MRRHWECSSSRLTHKAHATRATADRTGHSHTGRGRGGSPTTRPVLGRGYPQVAPDANDERILKAGASRRRSAYCDTPRANRVLAVSLRLHAPAALANARATTSRPPVAPKHAPSHNPSATARDGSGRTVGAQPSRGRWTRSRGMEMRSALSICTVALRNHLAHDPADGRP